jgi:hypothetical protein
MVVAKGNLGTPNPWIQIYSPVLNTSFFAHGKEISNLPKFCLTRCRQSEKHLIDRTWRLGATDVTPLTLEKLLEDNSAPEGDAPHPHLQTWGQGTVKTFHFGNKTYTLDITSGLEGRSQRLAFETGSLVQGSQVLPPGSPVFFQTAFSAGAGREKSKGTTRIASLTYDWSRYASHAGLFPSPPLFEKVEEKLGSPHIVLGYSVLADVRAVSFLDLVEENDDALDQISFDSLLRRAFAVLAARLARLTLGRNDNPDSHDPHTFSQLERSVAALAEDSPLVVFIIPNFHPRKTWLTLVNRHFNNNVQGSLPVLKVRFLEMTKGEHNIHNVGREAGLLARHVDEWRVGDYQESHQLFVGGGPFAQLVPGGVKEVQEHNSEHLTYLLETTDHHLSHQLLVTSLSPNSKSGTTVPCTLVDCRDNPLPSLGSLRHPSLQIVYAKSREEASQTLLRTILRDLPHDDMQRYNYPDARKVAARLTLGGADKDTLDSLVLALNTPDLNNIFRAGLWDELHQDQDDAFIRTVLCRSGFTPDVEVLTHLDPNIQYRVVDHGILRIFSTLPTTTLITLMRDVNSKAKALDPPARYTRGEKAVFQAVIDGDGLTWVGSPATPPPRRGASAWGGREQSFSYQGPPPTKHRIIIRGPALNWPNAMTTTALTDMGLSPDAQAAATWATTKGTAGVFIVVDHPSVEQLQPTVKMYDGFIIVELEKLPETDIVHLRSLVFRDVPIYATHQTKVHVLAAIRGQSTGRHQRDPAQERLITSISSPPISNEPSLPPNPAPSPIAILPNPKPRAQPSARSVRTSKKKSHKKAGDKKDPSDHGLPETTFTVVGRPGRVAQTKRAEEAKASHESPPITHPPLGNRFAGLADDQESEIDASGEASSASSSSSLSSSSSSSSSS